MQELSLNGIDLAYIERGQGQPVLFVHGGIGDYRYWERQVEAFGSRYRAIAVSCRGHWPNRKPEPGTYHWTRSSRISRPSSGSSRRGRSTSWVTRRPAASRT